MIRECSLKNCARCENQRFITTNDDLIPSKINIEKVLKYIVCKIQRSIQKNNSLIRTYKRLLKEGSISFSGHVIYLFKSKSLKVLMIALEVFSELSDKIRLDILLQTLRRVSFEVNLILFLIDGLAIGTKYIWDLIKTVEPRSNLYKALIQRVNKTDLAEYFLSCNSNNHLQVLMSESSTLEKKLIHERLNFYFSPELLL